MKVGYIQTAASFGEKTNNFDRKQIRIIFSVKSIGSISSIFGGFFGILSLIMFSLFKSTIIQPYDARDAFPPNSTPPVRFAPSFYLSLVIYIVFVFIGMIIFIQSLRLFRQFNQKEIQSSELIN